MGTGLLDWWGLELRGLELVVAGSWFVLRKLLCRWRSHRVVGFGGYFCLTSVFYFSGYLWARLFALWSSCGLLFRGTAEQSLHASVAGAGLGGLCLVAGLSVGGTEMGLVDLLLLDSGIDLNDFFGCEAALDHEQLLEGRLEAQTPIVDGDTLESVQIDLVVAQSGPQVLPAEV